MQVKRLNNVQVSTTTMQVQPASRARVTQLRSSAHHHTGYAEPQPPSTGSDVTGSPHLQPEVRPAHVGAGGTAPRPESFENATEMAESSTEGVRGTVSAVQEVVPIAAESAANQQWSEVFIVASQYSHSSKPHLDGQVHCLLSLSSLLIAVTKL